MDLLTFDHRLKNCLLAKMEVRAKIISIFVFIMTVTSLESPGLLAIAATILLIIAAANRISPLILMMRFLWVLPFIGLMLLFFPFITPGVAVVTIRVLSVQLVATEAGMIKALLLGLRVMSAMLAVSLLVLTTPMPQLLQGFRQLRAPALIVSLAGLTLRYMFVLMDEVKRMQLALRTRNFRQGKSFFHKQTMETLGFLVGMLFIRAFERGDRIYVAMLARGYQSEPSTAQRVSLTSSDWLLSICVIGFAVTLKVMEWSV